MIVSGKFKNRILVLSPYHAQVEAIRNALRVAKVEGVLVSTVDSAQGLESDIVIVSLARNRVGSKNAFFEDRKRINVMLSRARERLVIIAAMKEVTAFSSAWKEVFSIAKDMGRREVANLRDEAMNNDHEARIPPVGFYEIQTNNSLSPAALEC